MLAEWCARWRDGRTICGHKTQRPAGFYYLAADRHWDSHAEWFAAVGFSTIPHYALVDDLTVELSRYRYPERAYDCFLECLNTLDPAPGGHVFVDPIAPFFIAGDSNKARDVAFSLWRYAALCQERQINLTCVAHFAKQKVDPKDQYARPQDRIAGSYAYSGFSDTQIYLIEPNKALKQPFHLLGWNPRHSAPEEFPFIRDEASGLFVPYEAYEDATQRDAVLSCLPEDAAPIAAVAIIQRAMEKTGLQVTQLERYLAQLVRLGQIRRVRRGVYQRTKPIIPLH